MTALIICSSSASRMPCSPPRSMMSRSSSALIRASLVTLAPKTPAIAEVTRVRIAINGLRTRASSSIGPLNVNANRSGLDSARVFGTSSAKMIVNSASTTVTISSARPSAVPVSSPASVSSSARAVARFTAAYADAKNPITVSPSWETARNRPGSACRRRTRLAAVWPSSASCSTRLRRSETSAISAATKNPSSRVRMTMTRMLTITAAGLPRWPRPRPRRRLAQSHHRAALVAARGCAPASRRPACRAGRRG